MPNLEPKRRPVAALHTALRAAVLLSSAAGCVHASPGVPDWAADAIWYQIFPERFANGDPTNDPTRVSLEWPPAPSENWTVSSWTADWYQRDLWEEELGDDFYDNGVFLRRYGGDLQGVIDRLDYLVELGITAIYFNPVFHARSLHKYDGSSFHHIDPYFGPDPEGDLAIIETETADPDSWQWTAADRLFLKLLEEAKARDLRVIIDGVFNHSGTDFFAFKDIRRQQADSRYIDWYVVTQFDDPETKRNEFDYEGWWGFKALPIFRDSADGEDLHPGPKRYIFDATRRWMDPDGNGDPADGIDGWRLDVAEEVPVGFWPDWNRHVRSINPEAYTVSEVWGDASHFIAAGGFSATMNYWAFAHPVKGWLIDNVITPSLFAAMLEERRSKVPEPVAYAMQNLMDSHDTDRLASMIVNRKRDGFVNFDVFDYDMHGHVSARHSDTYDISKPGATDRRIQKLVALFQATYVGAPMIFYGTEAGMWGGDDPDDRMPMVWPEREYENQTRDPRGPTDRNDPVAFDEDLFEFHRDLFHLRQASEALRRGAFTVVAMDDEADMLAYGRQTDTEGLLVVLNRDEAARSLEVPLAGNPAAVIMSFGPVMVTVGGADAIKVRPGPESLTVTLPGLTGAILAPR